MKRLVFLSVFLILLFTSCASHTSFNDFYQENQKDSDISFGMNTVFLRTFLNAEDFEEIKPLLKKAKHIRILAFEENATQMAKKFNRFIKHSPFDELITIKDDGDKIKIYTLHDEDKIKEVVLNIGTDDELFLVGLKTNLGQDDIAKLIDQSGIN